MEDIKLIQGKIIYLIFIIGQSINTLEQYNLHIGQQKTAKCHDI